MSILNKHRADVMKLLIADDHTLFRDALVQYIERAEPDASVLLSKDLPGVFDILREEKVFPDLILLDLKMPGMNGMEGLARLREEYPDVAVSLMSGTAENEDVRRAINMGAMGYFPKTLSGKALLKAIQLVLAGEKFLPIDNKSNEIMSSYYDGRKPKERPPSYGESSYGENSPDKMNLTAREQEVLSFLLDGLSNKEIARSLDLQVVTVKLHVRGIFRKLGAKNRTQAALKAKELGVVEPSSSAGN